MNNQQKKIVADKIEKVNKEIKDMQDELDLIYLNKKANARDNEYEGILRVVELRKNIRATNLVLNNLRSIKEEC